MSENEVLEGVTKDMTAQAEKARTYRLVEALIQMELDLCGLKADEPFHYHPGGNVRISTVADYEDKYLKLVENLTDHPGFELIKVQVGNRWGFIEIHVKALPEIVWKTGAVQS